MDKHLRYLFFVFFVFFVLELFLHIFPFNPDFNISPGEYVMIRDSDTKIHRWVGGKLAYELIPNSTYGDITINSGGFRDREFFHEKNMTYRIAMIGDSVTFGWNIKTEETFSKQLEQMLPEDYEVLNFGVNGYYANQEIELMKSKVISYEPDLVIFVMVLNDIYGGAWKFWEEDGTSYYVRQSYMQKPTIVKSEKAHNILKNSKIYESFNIISYMLLKDHIDFRFFYDGDDLSLVKEFKEARLLAESKNISLIIMTVPMVIDYSDYPYLVFHEQIENIATDSGIEYLDLYPMLKEYDFNEFKIDENDEYHYNPYGNKIIAEKILYYLKENKIV